MIRKAAIVCGRTLQFRDVAVADAAFVLSLRTDPNLSRHLSPTVADVSAQIAWIQNYQKLTDQAYFIIEHLGEPVGTVRLYGERGDSFEWGSWIIKPGVPSHVSIESALMVYAYAMDWLGFRCSHFSVKPENVHVWQFHERFGAKRVKQSEDNFEYTIGLSDIEQSRKRYARFLPNGVQVKAWVNRETDQT